MIPKKDNLEVSSDQLRAELIEIKERLGAIETISSISNKTVVEAYVRSEIKSEHARKIMKLCETPQSLEQLRATLKFETKQALHHHLKPLREADLLRQHTEDNGNLTLEWSNLFRRLPPAAVRTILSDTESKPKKP